MVDASDDVAASAGPNANKPNPAVCAEDFPAAVAVVAWPKVKGPGSGFGSVVSAAPGLALDVASVADGAGVWPKVNKPGPSPCAEGTVEAGIVVSCTDSDVGAVTALFPTLLL